MLSISYTIWVILSLFVIFQARKIKKYKDLNENEKNLIATITHDLKSPASAQVNMLNLLMKGQFGELNPKQYEMIKLTCDSGKYMSDMVSSITASYCCDSNLLKINKQLFDITEIIQIVCDENKYLIKENNQSIIFNYNQKNYMVYGDKLQITRVIFNLISNAITYGFKNSFIVIDLIQNSNYTEFSISNKSNPISKNELKNIFKKFNKTKNSKFNKASTGLGLYSAKKIIKLHRGKIYATCTRDGIFTFGIKIPNKSLYFKQIKKEKILSN